MGTRPDDLAARASQLEADADGIRTQNELKLQIDDTRKRLDDAQDRLADNEYKASQERVDAERLQKEAADIKRQVTGDSTTTDPEVRANRPSGERAREMWQQAQEKEAYARAGLKRADEHDKAAAQARQEVQQYEEQVRELQDEYEDNSLMDPGYDETLPQGDFEPGTGADVAALVATEAAALDSDTDGVGDALEAQVAMAAGADPLAPEDGTLDGANPEDPGFGPTPQDPTIDVETPEDPGYGPAPEDPTIDVETPEVPDVTLPEPDVPADGGMEPAMPDAAGSDDFS